MTLTAEQRADRKLSGLDLQRNIAELGAMYGWLHMHVRPAQTAHGWRTPITGQLGKGWPDLTMVQPLRRRTIAVEVKRELSDPLTLDQEYVHRMLREAGWDVFVWRPSDLTSGRIQWELAR